MIVGTSVALLPHTGACLHCLLPFSVPVILPVLAICFFVVKIGDRKALWRQGGVALAAFTLAYLPVIPSLQYMLHTRSDHVFDVAPKLADLGWTLAPEWLAYIFVGAVLVAAATRRLDLQSRLEGWRIVLCAALAFITILILYGVSVETSIHVFVERYRLVAIPGIALCWAWLVSRIDSHALRLLFCVAVVASVAYAYLRSPASQHHGYTWKYALEFVEKNASADNAPVLICSDFPETDGIPMPVGSAVKDSGLFAPLTYYKLSVPVVGLPRALNDEAIRIGSSFVQEAARRGERFLALAFGPSYKTLQFIAASASGTQYVRVLGTFDGIAVLEFIPRAQADGTGMVGDQSRPKWMELFPPESLQWTPPFAAYDLADCSPFAEELGPSYLVHRTPPRAGECETCRTRTGSSVLTAPGFAYSKLMLTASALRTSMADGRTEIASKGATPISK